jgi:hypothetical protein
MKSAVGGAAACDERSRNEKTLIAVTIGLAIMFSATVGAERNFGGQALYINNSA